MQVFEIGLRDGLPLSPRVRNKFGSNHDWKIRRQRCHADGGTCVLPSLVTEHIDDNLGERIHHDRRLGITRLGLDEPLTVTTPQSDLGCPWHFEHC